MTARITFRIRERRPDLRNFRDDHETIVPDLLRILENLQRRPQQNGYGCVSTRELRAMIHQDTDRVCSEDTIRKALRRLELEGKVEVRWIHPTNLRPDGEIARVGCLRTRVAQSRPERRHIRARAPHVDHRQGVGGGRIVERSFDSILSVATPPAPAARNTGSPGECPPSLLAALLPQLRAP